MSGKANTPRVNSADYAAIKRGLKTKTIREVAEETGRSRSTVARVSTTKNFAAFTAKNKGYMANQKAKLQTVPTLTVETSKLTPKSAKALKKAADTKPGVAITDQPAPAILLDTLQKPEKRSKAHAAEVLSLQTDIERLTKERDAAIEEAHKAVADAKKVNAKAERLLAANELLNNANEDLSNQLKAQDDVREAVRLARTDRTVRATIARLVRGGKG